LYSEVIQVPPELSAFASDPQFGPILLKVKEQSNINTITLERAGADRAVVSIMIDSPTREAALLARKLVEIHFKQQIRVKEAEARLQKVQNDLYAAQGEMASGLMVEFTVNPELIGLIIGKKGSRIKAIEQQYGCGGINVDGNTGRIRVTGPDASSVQRAREQLDLIEHSFSLNASQVEWFSKDRFNGSLSKLFNAKFIICLMTFRRQPI
jgi:predicted RNA-binding protein YlqC (UPF0109 family)